MKKILTIQEARPIFERARKQNIRDEEIMIGLMQNGYEVQGVDVSGLNDYMAWKKEQNTKPKVDTTTRAGKLEGFSRGFVKSGLSTLEGFHKLGKKVTDTVDKAIGIEPRANDHLFGDKMAKEIETTRKGEGLGRFAGEVAQFAIPGSKVAKATQGAKFATKIGAMAATDGAVEFVKSGGDVKKTATTAGMSAAIPVAGKLVKFGVKDIAGGLLKRLAGTATGAGTDVIDTILSKPKVAKKAMRGNGVKILSDAAQEIVDKVAVINKQAGDDYARGIKNITKKYAVEQVENGTKILTKSGEKIISKSDVFETALNKLNDFGVKIDTSDGIKLKNTVLASSDERKLLNVFKEVDQWDDLSIDGYVRLSRKIKGHIAKVPETESQRQLAKILGAMSNSLRRSLGEAIPEFKAMNLKYAGDKKIIKELQSHFGKVSDDPQQLVRTVRKLQNLFTKNKEQAREILERLDLGDIDAQVAGAELSGGTLRSTAAIGGNIGQIAQTLIPRKAIGRMVGETGEVVKVLEKNLDTISGMTPAIRAAVLNIIKNMEQK